MPWTCLSGLYKLYNLRKHPVFRGLLPTGSPLNNFLPMTSEISPRVTGNAAQWFSEGMCLIWALSVTARLEVLRTANDFCSLAESL